MWDAIARFFELTIENGGMAGIILIVWMVDRYFLVRDLRATNEKLITLVTENTKAYTEFTSVLQNLNTSITQLCSRI